MKDAYRLNDIGRGLANLDLEDVKRGPGEGETEPAYTVTMRTFDGLVVELAAVKAGDATLGTFTARVEEVEAAAGDEAASQSGSDTASASDTKSEQAESAAEGDKPDPQAVKAEAETLNAKWDGWLYTLPGYKADHFARKRAELVEKPDVKEALDSLQNPSPSSSPAPAPAESDAQPTDSSGESSSSN